MLSGTYVMTTSHVCAIGPGGGRRLVARGHSSTSAMGTPLDVALGTELYGSCHRIHDRKKNFPTKKKNEENLSIALPMPTKTSTKKRTSLVSQGFSFILTSIDVRYLIRYHPRTHPHKKSLQFSPFLNMTYQGGLQRSLNRGNILKAKKRTLMDVVHLRKVPVIRHRNDTEDDAAQLLLSMFKIVTNEIKNDSHAFDDEGDKTTPYYSSDTDSSVGGESLADNQENVLRLTLLDVISPEETSSSWSRVRTISIDSPQHHGLLPPQLPEDEEWENRPTLASLGLPTLISPQTTPIGRGRPLTMRRIGLKHSQKAKRRDIPKEQQRPKPPQLPPVSSDIKEYKKKAIATSIMKEVPIKKIGRRKFSWKNYPGTHTISPSLENCV